MRRCADLLLIKGEKVNSGVAELFLTLNALSNFDLDSWSKIYTHTRGKSERVSICALVTYSIQSTRCLAELVTIDAFAHTIKLFEDRLQNMQDFC